MVSVKFDFCFNLLLGNDMAFRKRRGVSQVKTIYKDNTVVVQGETHTIPALALTDAGSWTCEVFDGKTNLRSTAITVHDTGKYSHVCVRDIFYSKNYLL